MTHHHTKKQDEVISEYYVVCVCSCRTSAVTRWVIWSSGCICPPWLPKTPSLWLSPMSFRTMWVALPRETSCPSFRSYLTHLSRPTGHRRELQCAEWSGTAEGPTERRALPSPRGHDAEWRTGETSAAAAATEHCVAPVYTLTRSFSRLCRTAAGRGAQRWSAMSSRFSKGRPPSSASAAEFMMISSEK